MQTWTHGRKNKKAIRERNVSMEVTRSLRNSILLSILTYGSET